MNENEIKAREMMQYATENMDLLKNCLRKNITYNEDYFEDAYNETIVNIYNNILKNGTKVKDKKNFFFWCLKNTYIQMDKKEKKKKITEERGLFEDEKIDFYEEESVDEVEREKKPDNLLAKLYEILFDKFGEQYTNIYLMYVMERAEGRYSYKDIAKRYNLSYKEVSVTINEIKKFVKENNKINEIREKYKYGSLD